MLWSHAIRTTSRPWHEGLDSRQNVRVAQTETRLCARCWLRAVRCSTRRVLSADGYRSDVIELCQRIVTGCQTNSSTDIAIFEFTGHSGRQVDVG